MHKLVRSLARYFSHPKTHNAYDDIAQKEGLQQHYLVANDHHANVYDAIEQWPPLIKENNRIRAAMVVGESNLLSLAPALLNHADLVLCADIDPMVAEHLQYQINCIRESESIPEFKARYALFWEAHRETDKWQIHSAHDFYSYVDSNMREHGFLFNADNYHSARHALSKLTVAHLNVNLFDRRRTSLLADLLKENHASISMLNLSNVDLYCAPERMDESLKEDRRFAYATALLPLLQDHLTPTIHSDSNVFMQQAELVTAETYIKRLSNNSLRHIEHRQYYCDILDTLKDKGRWDRLIASIGSATTATVNTSFISYDAMSPKLPTTLMEGTMWPRRISH